MFTAFLTSAPSSSVQNNLVPLEVISFLDEPIPLPIIPENSTQTLSLFNLPDDDDEGLSLVINAIVNEQKLMW